MNPKVNAIVTFLPEAGAQGGRRGRREARQRAARSALLAGLPIAYKDMIATKGIRTTFGSPIYADNVPDADHAAGRAPASAAGRDHARQDQHAGVRRRQPDLQHGVRRDARTRTTSPRPAAAPPAARPWRSPAACCPSPTAPTSARSLRNPGNFCNVVGFRPTPGRVAVLPDGRRVGDAVGHRADRALGRGRRAFLFSAMAGPEPALADQHHRAGLACSRRPLEAQLQERAGGLGSRDLGGLPVDPRVTAVLEEQRKVFESLGCIVEDAEPDLSGVGRGVRRAARGRVRAEVRPRCWRSIAAS